MEENREPPEFDDSNFPSGQFDTAAKNATRDHPEDFIRYCLEISDAQVIRVLETEQPTVQW